MGEYVIKFGEKYVKDYGTFEGEIFKVELSSNLFDAIKAKESPADELKKFINLGAEVTEITFYETNKNWEIKRELEE